jgi:membrane protease YdiL (CAAX protease family)
MAKLSHLNPLSQVLVLLGILLVSIGMFSIISLLLLEPIFGINLLTNPGIINDLTDPKVLPALKFMQTIQAIAIFIFPPVIVAFLVDDRPWSFLKTSRGAQIATYLLVALLMLSSLPLINWLAELNSKISLPAFLSDVEQWMKDKEEAAAEYTLAFLRMGSLGEFLFNLFMIALIPAIGEELLFRGALQTLFTRMFKNPHTAILVAAIIFSAMHMQFYGFIPRMLMGVLFGYLVLWFDSLWPAIIAHFVNNGSAVLMAYLSQEKLVPEDIDKAGTGSDQWTFVIISVILVTALIYILKKASKINQPVSL